IRDELPVVRFDHLQARSVVLGYTERIGSLRELPRNRRVPSTVEFPLTDAQSAEHIIEVVVTWPIARVYRPALRSSEKVVLGLRVDPRGRVFTNSFRALGI